MRSILLLASLLVTSQLSAEPPAEPRYRLVLQAPPATGVSSVAVSPDGTLVATAAGEGGVRLYDAKSGKLLRVIGEAGDRGVLFSPDGKTLTAAGFHMDKLVGIFEVQTGKRIKTLAGHTEWEAYANALSPDGKLLASTGADKQILVWDLDTGKLRHQFKNQPLVVSALAFSPDSATLASGGGDKKIHLWNMTTGKLQKSLAGHDEWINLLAYSPDGKTIASGSCDWGFHRGHDWPRPASRGPEQSEWRLWNVETGEVKRTQSLRGRMLALAISPDGKSVAFGRDNDVFVLSDDTAGRYGTHHGTVTSIAFTPDGAALITGSHDQTARRITLATGRTEWEAPGWFEQVNSVALSNDASLLVTGSSDHRFARGKLPAGSKGIGLGAVRLWDMHTGRLIQSSGSASEQIMAVAISPDGRHYAAGGGIENCKGIARIHDGRTGAAIWSHSDFAKEVLSIAFAPDGLTVAIAARDGLVTICETKSGKVERTLADHAGGATSVTFSPDGSFIVCGQALGGVRIWDAKSGRLLQTCKAGASAASFSQDRAIYSINPDRLFNSVSLSRDGSVLADCNSSINNEFVDAVRLWNPRTGELVRDFAAEKIHGRPMALSPDGSILATGGKSVQLWDAKTGKKLHQLYGHLKRTQSIVFSTDGRTLVAGGSWGTVNIWDVATGKHRVTLFAFPDVEQPNSNHWLAYHREGYYSGSPSAEQFLGWRDGEALKLPAALRAELRRPELVEAALKSTP